MYSGLNFIALALFISSCFGGPDFMSQSKRNAAGVDARNIKVNVDGEVLSATVSATASFTQVVSAPETSSLKGVSAAFSPGTLAIDTTIVVEEAASFANERLLAELGISNNFTVASVAVAVQPTVKTNPAQPFQIALPLPGLNTLNLNGNENVVVAYRYEDATIGKVIAGILPNSELQFNNGNVQFLAKYFGVFQATITEQKIVSAVEATSESVILTKRETAKLAPLQILNRTPVVVQAGKTVEITGQNLRPTLFLAVNGKPVSKVDVLSDGKAQFAMPQQTKLGLANITAEQDGVTEKMSLVYTNANDYPVITLAETEVCAGSKYYDLNGTLKTGTKNCGPVLNWPSTNGTAGQVLGTDGSGNLSWINASSGGAGAVTSAEITDGTITDADINANAGISYLKISGLGNAASKNVGVSASDVAAGNHTHSMSNIAEAASCSFNEILKFTGSSWTCAALPTPSFPSVSQPPGTYTISEPTGSLLVASTPDSMWTLPNSMGTGYSITVKNNSTGYLKIMAPVYIDGELLAYYLFDRGSATFTYSGSEWFVTNVQADVGRALPDECGGAADYCYDDNDAKTAGFARTPTGKMLKYVTTSFGASVWKEKNGDRLLAANGSDAWSMQLNPDGKASSGIPMTSWDQIAGRACPTNVYENDGNKFVTGKCLYYVDMGYHSLSEAGTTQTLPTMGLGSWSTPAWYAGNIKACGERGMRLPTVYETTATDTVDPEYPVSDGSPAFALANGVPINTVAWTATTASSPGEAYISVDSYGMSMGYTASMSQNTRCVFP